MGEMETTEIQRLRRSLTKVLEAKAIDYDAILRLSAELAKHDPKHVRFSVDAGHISRLGLELVSKPETAVAELVKNAYDADATKVTLTFVNAETEGGMLEIVDNGNGMDRDQIVDGFMRISTPDKLENPVSPRYHRHRAGQKGIGRFAAQRLGRRLRLLSEPRGGTTAYRIDVDWDAFVSGRALEAVSNRIIEVQKADSHGTTLKIYNLRDAWSDAKIERVFRYVSELLQPFPIRRVSTRKRRDPGFKAEFRRGRGGTETYETVASVSDTFFRNALAKVTGEVDRFGRAHWSVNSSRYKLKSVQNRIGANRDDPTSKYDHLRNVQFSARYFILRPDYVQGSIFTTLRNSLDQYGGFRVYRNGFRVLPFGEQGNDWLGLDKLSARRSKTLAPISNRSWFGYIQIDDPEGELFQETSSREGLVENESYNQLVDFVSRSVLSAVQKIDEVRSKAGEKESWHEERRRPEESASDAEQLIKRVQQLGRAASETEEEADEEAKTIELGIRQLVENTKGLLQELSFLRILATMGLTVAVFVHEISAVASAMSLDMGRIEDKNSSAGDSADAVESLRANFQTLQSYTAYFNEIASYNAARELESVDLEEAVDKFVHAMSGVVRRHGISVKTEHKSKGGVFTCPMHRSEWSSILLNFLTNSMKAISRTSHEGEILIVTDKQDGEAVLDFSDNGDGIPKEDWERVFDAFYTTTSPASPFDMETEQGTGTGLGLKIVRDIVSAVKGTVSVVPASKGYSTRMRILVPAETKG